MGLFNWLGRKEEEVEGVARTVRYDYQESTDKKGRPVIDTVINFRIEHTDKAGNVINVVPVEIHGGIIEGEITESNIIKAKGKMVDGVIRVNEAKNITTNSKICSKELKLGREEVIVMGVARTVEITQWSLSKNLDFRVECTDKEGNIINVVPVEMRGFYQGRIVEGDRVKVKGKRKDGIIKASEALNITTNSIVRAWKVEK